MRPLFPLAILLALAGCASNEYSSVPEPSGEWVPANPPGFAASPGGPVPGRMISASREHG
jgi:hypothetical protein